MISTLACLRHLPWLAGVVLLIAPVRTETCLPLPQDSASWWRAESNALDSVSTNHGSLRGNLGFLPGRVGLAYALDGIDDEVLVSASTFNEVTNDFTMEMWVLPTGNRGISSESVNGTAGVSSGQRYAVFPAHGDALFGAGHAGAGISIGTNGVSVFEHAAFYLPSPLVYEVPLVDWTHVAVVYSNAVPSLYLNGSLVRVGLQSEKIVHPSTEHGGGPYGYYAGLLDEYTIYRRALTEVEINAIYTAGSFGKCAEPIQLFVRLEDGQVLLEWPAPCDDCVLEESDSLATGAEWASSDSIPEVVGDRYRLIFSPSFSARFYRLVLPTP